MSSSLPYRSALVAWLWLAFASGHAVVLLAQAPPALFVEPARQEDARVSNLAGSARARRLAVRTDLLAAALVSDSAPRAPFLLNLFDDVVLAVERERLESDGRGHASWVGAVRGDAASTATFTWNGDYLVGSVVTRGVAYDFATDERGAVVVNERGPMPGAVELPPRRPGAPEARRADQFSGPSVATPTIDVLVFYTAAARARAGGGAQIQAALASAVAVTNAAFQRSAVNAEIRAVGVTEVPYVESANPVQPIADDLFAISLGGAASAAVEGARNAAGADLVALVTGRPSIAGGCGIAWIGPSPSAAYSVTEQACLFAGQWSFSHELGHNFGADHAPGDSTPYGAPYAQGYRAGNVRTLMAYAVSGSPPRILSYSSSTVLEPPVTGLPTGNSLQDNARRINETAPTLASYRGAVAAAPATPAWFTASVSGATVTLSWTPASAGGPVTSFEVEAGPTPHSAAFGHVPVTQSPAVFPNVPPGDYYMRLRSVGPGGVSAPTPDAFATVPGACVVPGLPALTAAVSGGTVTLTWSAMAGSSPATYYLGVGATPGADTYGIYPMGASTSMAATPPPGTYYVRVAASNACGIGPVSGTLAVTVP